MCRFVTLDKSNPHAGSARLRNKENPVYGNRKNVKEAEKNKRKTVNLKESARLESKENHADGNRKNVKEAEKKEE